MARLLVTHAVIVSPRPGHKVWYTPRADCLNQWHIGCLASAAAYTPLGGRKRGFNGHQKHGQGLFLEQGYLYVLFLPASFTRERYGTIRKQSLPGGTGGGGDSDELMNWLDQHVENALTYHDVHYGNNANLDLSFQRQIDTAQV
jgi:hypothetical protein